MADALRDFLVPAESAPGTPSSHKDWRHLAAYLRTGCNIGSRPERYVASARSLIRPRKEPVSGRVASAAVPLADGSGSRLAAAARVGEEGEGSTP